MNASPSVTARAQAQRRWVILVVVCLGMFAVELDTSIVTIALPSIQQALGFTRGSLQWVVDAYLLVFGGFLLLGGRAGDLYGQKRVFGLGLGLFTLGAAIGALSPSVDVMVLGRALQGLGAALLTPVSLATLTTSFPDPSERSRALAAWTAVEVASVALGLVLGGVITSFLSWRWIFVLTAAAGTLALAGALRYLSVRRRERAAGSFDLGGAALATCGLISLTYGLTKAPVWGWSSYRTVAMLAIAGGLLLAFVLLERRVPRPLMPLTLFRSRSLTVGNLSFFLSTSGVFAMYYFSALYLQGVRGYDPLHSGLALLPLAVGTLVGAGAAQPLMRLRGLRPVAIAGLAGGAAGMVLLTSTTAHSSYLAGFLPGLSAVAVGLGLSMVPFTLLATSGPADSEAGLASGLYTAVSTIGGALGLAVLATVAADRTAAIFRSASPLSTPSRLAAQPGALIAGYHAAFLVGAALMLASALLLVLFLERGDIPELAARADTVA